MDTKIHDIAKEIIKKKELSTLDIDFVIERVNRGLDSNKKAKERLEKSEKFSKFKKTAAYKELIKEIRSNLREIYGVFQNDPNKQKQLVQKLITAKDMNEKMRYAIDLLQTHQSTKERSIHYQLIYKTLLQHIKKLDTIFDVGCGINPLSLIYLPQKPYVYATDISQEDMKNMQKMLNSLDIKSTCFAADITGLTPQEIAEKTDNKEFDLCLMLKLLDTLDSNKRYASRNIMQQINAKYFLLSFPKFSLGGKRDIVKNKRSWVHRLIDSLDSMTLIYEFEVPNEIFYLIEKQCIIHHK